MKASGRPLPGLKHGRGVPETGAPKGNIGSFDFGGTKADILLGTYGNGQTGAPHVFDYLSAYFTGVSGFTYVNWGWTYMYKNQTWRNFSSGTTRGRCSYLKQRRAPCRGRA